MQSRFKWNFGLTQNQFFAVVHTIFFVSYFFLIFFWTNLKLLEKKMTRKVYVKSNITMINIDDVAQVFKADVNLLFYFHADMMNINENGRRNLQFANLDAISWEPHIDFRDEVEEAEVTDKSFWYDAENNLIFGRINLITTIQQRFDHSRFPFDRQLIRLDLFSNNCLMLEWEDHIMNYPKELRLNHPGKVQLNLTSMADPWTAESITCKIQNDKAMHSTLVQFEVFLSRNSFYYIVNLGFVYSLIVSSQACLYAFDESSARFRFSLQLILTAVAFKFVATATIPKCPYQTSLDVYINLGFLFLCCRIAFDSVFLLKFLSIERDLLVTATLSAIWFVISFIYICFGKCIFSRNATQVKKVCNNDKNVKFRTSIGMASTLSIPLGKTP